LIDSASLFGKEKSKDMLQLIIVADVIKVCLVINLLLGEDCACWKVGTEIQMQYQLIDFAE